MAVNTARFLKETSVIPAGLKRARNFRVLIYVLILILERVWDAALNDPVPTWTILLASIYRDFKVTVKDFATLGKLFLVDFSWKALQKTWMVHYEVSLDVSNYPSTDRVIVLNLLQAMLCLYNYNTWSTAAVLAWELLPLGTCLGNPYSEHKVGISSILLQLGASTCLLDFMFYSKTQARHAGMENNFLWKHIACYVCTGKGSSFHFHAKLKYQTELLMQQIYQPVDYVILFRVIRSTDITVRPHLVFRTAVMREECVPFQDVFQIVDLNNSEDHELFWSIILEIFVKSEANFVYSTRMLPQILSLNSVFAKKLVTVLVQDRWRIKNAKGEPTEERFLEVNFSENEKVAIVIPSMLLPMNMPAKIRHNFIGIPVNI